MTLELVRTNISEVREASQLGLEAHCQVVRGAKDTIDVDGPLDIRGMQMLSRER